MIRSFIDDNNGAVLVITIAIVSVLIIIGSAFASIVIFQLRNAPRQLQRVQGFYTTEAGLDKAIALLRNDEDWLIGGDGSATDNFPGEGEWYPLYDPSSGADVSNFTLMEGYNGTYSVLLRNPPDSEGKEIEIASGGKIEADNPDENDITRVIKVRMLLASSLFNWAIFGGEGVKITGNADIDSYNSDDGLYEHQTHGENGDVGSNDDIVVTGSATILGDATCGPDPDDELRITGSAYISGSTDPASELVDLPSLNIEFPFSPSGKLKKTGSGTHTLSEGTYCYTQVKFTGSHELRTEGDVTIYCESLSFTGTSKIRVNGTLTFYCTGDFKCTGSGIINTDKKPEDFALYCTGEDIKLTGNSDFHGVVYAPYGDASITGGHDYYGSIIAGWEVKGTGNCEVHYDEALASDTEGTQQGNIVSWHELNPDDLEFSILFPDD